jgi:hypothetical protein
MARRIKMEFTLRTLVIAIVCIIVALVIISLIVSWGTGGKSLIDAFLEFIRGEIPAQPSP